MINLLLINIILVDLFTEKKIIKVTQSIFVIVELLPDETTF